MKFNITNRSSKVRRFNAGGRFLTLAGGEVARGVVLSKEEQEALDATGEFHVREIADSVTKRSANNTETASAEPQALKGKTGS